MEKRINPDDSIALGLGAAEIAASALEDLGREMIRQKALDIAQQIEIYLQQKSLCTIEEIKNDHRLASLSVRTIWGSGYSAVHDTNGINVFHHTPSVIGKDLYAIASGFPQFWNIIERSLRQETDGYYDWPEPDGQVHRKYMYCAPIYPAQLAPVGLVVATTISIEEFLKPSREISQRIIALSQRVDEFTRAEKRRNSQLRSINEFSRKISSFLNVNDLLPYVVNTLSKTFRFCCVRIFLLNKESCSVYLAAQAGESPDVVGSDEPGALKNSTIEWVASTSKPYLSNEPLPPWRSARPAGIPYSRMAVPIKIGRDVLGVLDIIDDAPQGFADVDLFTIWPLADQVATAIENARLHNELQEMAVIDERNRIAREIHDTLAQGFAGISMLVESTKRALKANDMERAEELLDRTRNLTREKLLEARQSVRSLRPHLAVEEELETLIDRELRQLATTLEIETHLDISGTLQAFSPDVKMAMLRIFQESLNNIKKHARASQVNVALTYSSNGVFLYVKDDGVGFDPQTPPLNSFGLTCMSERARLLGGSVIINSQIGKGTEIYVNMPL